MAPAVLLVLAVAAVVATLIVLPGGDVGTIVGYVVTAAAALLVLRYVLWPFLVWRATHYVFTDERVLLQTGVVARDRRDLPLSRVSDHAMNQRPLDRLFGSGTLTIESAGGRESSVLPDVPRVERVQTVLYELVEADHDRRARDGEDGDSAA